MTPGTIQELFLILWLTLRAYILTSLPMLEQLICSSMASIAGLPYAPSVSIALV